MTAAWSRPPARPMLPCEPPQRLHRLGDLPDFYGTAVRGQRHRDPPGCSGTSGLGRAATARCRAPSRGTTNCSKIATITPATASSRCLRTSPRRPRRTRPTGTPRRNLPRAALLRIPPSSCARRVYSSIWQRRLPRGIDDEAGMRRARGRRVT
jgi:hypothetical protein